MQKSGPFQANFYKGRLHTRQHSAYPAFINVTHEAALALPLDENFLQDAIFHDSDPGFPRHYIDEDFFAATPAVSYCRHCIFPCLISTAL